MEDIRNKVFDKERFNIDKERLKIIHYESPKRDAKPLSAILPSVINSLEAPVQDSILILRDNWNSLFGEQISKYSQPAFLSIIGIPGLKNSKIIAPRICSEDIILFFKSIKIPLIKKLIT